MGRGRTISSETAAQIVAYRNTEMTQCAIATRLGLAQSVVCRILQRYGKTKSFHPRKQSGRPRKSSNQTDRIIRRMAIKDPCISSTMIEANLPSSISLSSRTIRRRLQVDYKLRSYRPARKPSLSCKNIKDRLAFAKKYQHWTVEQWRKVIFSDETIVRQFENLKPRVRRPPGQRFNNRYVCPTVKHSPAIMVWGCISAEGRGGLSLIPQGKTVNGSMYLDILKEKLPAFMQLRNCDYFQHDGAPCHQTKAVKNWLLQQRIQIIGPWPGNSPDLNVIENCWYHLKKCVALKRSGSLNDLQNNIKQVWCTEITKEFCQKLVDSMPQRLVAVIANKGGSTKY